MARDETPPFARGETYYGNQAKDPALADPIHLCGKEYLFEPNSANDYVADDTSGRQVRVKIVQNKSSIPLLPKRIVRFKAADPAECVVDGYPVAATTDLIAGVVDEFLPAAGVPVDDFFYIVVDGPTTGKTLAASPGTILVGSSLEVGAGTSAVHNDAGRVGLANASPTAALLQSRAGRSEVANSVADTDIRFVAHFRSRY